MPHALPLRPNLLDAISNSMTNGLDYLFPESVILNVGNGMGQNQQAGRRGHLAAAIAAKILNGMSKRSYLGTSSAAFVIGHIGYLRERSVVNVSYLTQQFRLLDLR